MKRNAIFLAVASLFAEAALSQTVPLIPVNTLPTGGVVRKGDATINAPDGSKLTVDQTSKRALLDWASFDIGKDAWVHFNQTMGSTAITANRVPAGTTKTTIEGMLTAPGHVMVLNANGVLFTGSAMVNVGGLTASTGQINESHFEGAATAPITITGATGGQVRNAGTITLADTGLAAFVAPSVVNSGVIIATKGRIVLASAEAATLSLNGNDLYELAVTKGIAGGSIDNSGTLQATGTGGTIVLSALDAANLVSGLINLEGVQQATRIEVHGGVVELKSDLNATTVAGSTSTVNVYSGNGAQIQDGVDIAKSGGSVSAGAGTFAESLTIGKALTLNGAGKGLTIIDPAVNSATGILVTGNIGTGATVAVSDLTVQGGGIGIKVADFTTLGTITLDGVVVRDNSGSGFISSSGGSNPSTVANVNILNSVFAGNGVAGGSADINLFRFNGNALIKNVDILGTRGPNLNVATDYGLQIRGHGEVSNMTAAGTVKLENVRIAGNYRRAHLGIQRYSDASNITLSGVRLGGKLEGVSVGDGATISVLASNAGFGKFFSSDQSGALSLGDTTFAKLDAEPSALLDIAIGEGTAGLRVNAIGASFEGLARTLEDNFKIEKRVGHALDSAAVGGLVTWQAGNLYVTSDRSIQRGIDVASAGDAVNVQAGTFAEQLTINKSLFLLGAGADQTIITPVSLTADASGMRNILTIGGGAASNAEVSGFTFKGPVPEINAGIFVRDGAHAYIHDNKLTDVRESVELSGVQRGIGIFVGRNSLATSGTAVIENNIITGYQKGGIVVDGPGSQATITGNTVTGEGPTGATAQNGIQVSRGASATITGNTVSGNSYTGDDDATGILIFTPGFYLGQGSITVGPNTVSGNEVGIWTNDPRTLSTISLAGVSGNTRKNAVADYGGGYAGQGVNLEYPAWAPSNAAAVNATAFSGKEAGDIVDTGGALRVTGWSGFAAIQPAVEAVAAGGSVNVASGTYAENVVLNGLRNLMFSDVTLGGLTINSGAAGSGMQGSVTANGSTGFVFNAPVYLIGDASLATTGANITLNGDIQGFGGHPYALSLNAGAGNVTLVSGGTADHPLGKLDVASNNFTLLSTLWVSGYEIDALGSVALSGHTLNSIGGIPGTIDAGGNVTGNTASDGPVHVDSGGSVTITVNTPAPVEVHSDGPANVSGSAPSLLIEAPSGSATGNFGQVTNAGSGLIDVNGKPTVNASLAASADNNRVVPADVVNAAETEGGGRQRDAKLRRRKLQDAVEVLANGEALEIDLSPGSD